jgi:hypothetical protein
MPGLIRGMARTAAVVGTATATRNAVNRRQADKNYAAYEHAATQAAPPPQQQYAAPPPQQYAAPAPPPPDAGYPAPASQDDALSQLERYAALKQQGLLSDEEYEAKKKQLLGL